MKKILNENKKKESMKVDRKLKNAKTQHILPLSTEDSKDTNFTDRNKFLTSRSQNSSSTAINFSGAQAVLDMAKNIKKP